jgi:putative ABC transport system substrate-binding protein
VDELVHLKVDVLVVATTPGAQSATNTIPVVMVAVGDPVGSGLVASLARAGGNLTGVSLFKSGTPRETLGAAKTGSPQGLLLH